MLIRFLSIIFILSFAIMASIYTDAADAGYITNGLVSCWTFDDADAEGMKIKDAWGDHDATLMGDAELVEGHIGEAVQLDGAKDYVDIDVEINATITGPLTVEGWFNFTAMKVAGLHNLMGSRQGAWAAGTGLSYIYVNNYGNQGFKMTFRFHHDGEPCIIDYNFEPELGEWYHLVATYDGSKIRYYDGGEKVAEVGCNKPIKESEEALRIGWDAIWGDQCYFNGLVDEVRIYNRALSDDEVQKNFVGISPVEPDSKLALTWGEVKISK